MVTEESIQHASGDNEQSVKRAAAKLSRSDPSLTPSLREDTRPTRDQRGQVPGHPETEFASHYQQGDRRGREEVSRGKAKILISQKS